METMGIVGENANISVAQAQNRDCDAAVRGAGDEVHILAP